MITYSRALYPGRFQPFHLGHLEAIKYVLQESSEIIIMIGSALKSHTPTNPFTSSERMTMINLSLKEANIDSASYFIIPVPDLQIHGIWVSHVCSLVPRFDVVFTNEPLTKRLFVEARYNVKPIPFFNREIYSSTKIRQRILQSQNWKEMLLKSVSDYLEHIQGVERLKQLIMTDKVNHNT